MYHRGRVARIARITDDTRQGVLVAIGIFWPVDEGDAGINDLSSQKLADVGGGATFHETMVAIAGKIAAGTALCEQQMIEL